MEKAKILVIEDEEPIQELIQFNLERKNYRVKVVDSGEDALNNQYFCFFHDGNVL